MKVIELLPLLERIDNGVENAEFYVGLTKIGHIKGYDLKSELPIMILLESDIKIVTGSSDKRCVKIFLNTN